MRRTEGTGTERLPAFDFGTYTFIAMTSDPSGGEGNPPMFDTKEITVG